MDWNMIGALVIVLSVGAVIGLGFVFLNEWVRDDLRLAKTQGHIRALDAKIDRINLDKMRTACPSCSWSWSSDGAIHLDWACDRHREG